MSGFFKFNTLYKLNDFNCIFKSPTIKDTELDYTFTIKKINNSLIINNEYIFIQNNEYFDIAYDFIESIEYFEFIDTKCNEDRHTHNNIQINFYTSFKIKINKHTELFTKIEFINGINNRINEKTIDMIDSNTIIFNNICKCTLHFIKPPDISLIINPFVSGFRRIKTRAFKNKKKSYINDETNDNIIEVLNKSIIELFNNLNSI